MKAYLSLVGIALLSACQVEFSDVKSLRSDEPRQSIIFKARPKSQATLFERETSQGAILDNKVTHSLRVVDPEFEIPGSTPAKAKEVIDEYKLKVQFLAEKIDTMGFFGGKQLAAFLSNPNSLKPGTVPTREVEIEKEKFYYLRASDWDFPEKNVQEFAGDFWFAAKVDMAVYEKLAPADKKKPLCYIAAGMKINLMFAIGANSMNRKQGDFSVFSGKNTVSNDANTTLRQRMHFDGKTLSIPNDIAIYIGELKDEPSYPSQVYTGNPCTKQMNVFFGNIQGGIPSYVEGWNLLAIPDPALNQ